MTYGGRSLAVSSVRAVESRSELADRSGQVSQVGLVGLARQVARVGPRQSLDRASPARQIAERVAPATD